MCYHHILLTRAKTASPNPKKHRKIKELRYVFLYDLFRSSQHIQSKNDNSYKEFRENSRKDFIVHTKEKINCRLGLPVPQIVNGLPSSIKKNASEFIIKTPLLASSTA